MDPKIRMMSKMVGKLVNNVTPLELEASSICREMTISFDKINDSFKRLSSLSLRLHSEYKVVAKNYELRQFSKISQLYQTLSSTFDEWRKVNESETSNFFANIRMMFTFCNHEQQGILQVTNS